MYYFTPMSREEVDKALKQLDGLVAQREFTSKVCVACHKRTVFYKPWFSWFQCYNCGHIF